MGRMKDLLGDQPYEQRKPPPVLPPTGRLLKDEALDLVKTNAGDWFGQALMIVASLEHGWVGIPEVWRAMIEEKIGPSPNKNPEKVWGSLTSSAIKHHLIVRTGRRVPMEDPNSHARMTDEYRRI